MRTPLSIICLGILFVSFLETKAQDIIITAKNDTLNAKVLTISESITSYKLESYLDGPTYELSNGRIDKIIYENGEVFAFENGAPQGALIYDKYKNSIEFIASELTLLKAALAYSRFITKNLEVRVGGTLSLNQNNYGDYFQNYGDLQLNFHPLSYRKIDYYIGARGRIGNARRYFYDPYYYNGYQYYNTNYYNKVAGTIGLINGMRINLTQRFALNTAFSLDVYLLESQGAIQPVAAGIFGACYKF